MSNKSGSAKARLGILASRRGLLSIALLAGTIVSLAFTAQNVAVYSGWSDAAYHSTVSVTGLTWEANPSNTTITITVNFTAHNPSDTRMGLYLAHYTVHLYSASNMFVGQKDLTFPPQDVYNGHDVNFSGSFIVQNSTQSQVVSTILGATTRIWLITGYATFHSVYTDVTRSIISAYF